MYNIDLEIVKKIFKDNQIVYLSTPINTGEKYISWYNEKGRKYISESIEYKESLNNNVVQSNRKHADDVSKYLRKVTTKVIINPNNLEDRSLKFTQEQYYEFWKNIIKDIIDEIVFVDGWEYSIGCCHELQAALDKNINIYSENLNKLTIKQCKEKLQNSISIYKKMNMVEADKLQDIFNQIQNKYVINEKKLVINNKLLKDAKLHYIISNSIGNIAQYISFKPGKAITPNFIHMSCSYDRKSDYVSLIKSLIQSATSKTVNIRSFSEDQMKGNKIILNKSLTDLDEIIQVLKDNTLNNKYTIINENIDVSDCGVSGVTLGNIIEFSPDDTPKCVEKEGICSLPRELGINILSKVYDFIPSLNFDRNYRVEFSIHPQRQGVKREHTILWEYEYYDEISYEEKVTWPNNFSKLLGDKVFGLLLADALGLRVPQSTVIARRVAPFTFGKRTGLKEKWIRTCPVTKDPGKYFTGDNWIDPFELLQKEDKDNIKIASIISQDAVNAKFSGASIIYRNEENDIIEGVAGKGDNFMVGEDEQIKLPLEVIKSVNKLNNQVREYYSLLGTVSIEWVYDGQYTWLVQLNQIQDSDISNVQDVIVKGNPPIYENVYVKDGLDSLRNKIDSIKDMNIGIKLIGNVGITSHFGDLLRLNKIPSMLIRE